ncbi:MAG: response regulator [Anaerolineae bacterium]|nr:response regulator [Anaerolineae bacterium]
MTHHPDGTPIVRHLVFVLNNGTFVVQWENERVQDIFSGAVLPFEDRLYGHAITDNELEHLRKAGRIAGYDRSYVWLHPLPESERFSRFTVQEESSERVRHYYLNTTLPHEQLESVRWHLHELGLDAQYSVQEQGEIVAIMNREGQPFARLADAENALNVLQRAASDLLKDAAVAFVEHKAPSHPPGDTLDQVDVLDLDSLIASQTRKISSGNRVIVGIDQDEDFLAETAAVIADVGAEFVPLTSGQEALHTIEDLEPDLVIMELVLPDAHAWQILARMRANQALAAIPVIIVSAVGSPADQVFALTVARVHDYLVKPVSSGELRRSIWMAIHKH